MAAVLHVTRRGLHNTMEERDRHIVTFNSDKNSIEPEYTNYGITMDEANQYLDWIVYRSRNSKAQDGIIDANEYSFTGACHPTQQQVSCVMDKVIGSENVHPINTESIISHPDKDVTKRQYSSAVRHCVTVVSLPILDESANVVKKDFLIDPTFRQFCLSENCNTDRYNIKNEYENKVAPDPAYFLSESEEGKKLAATLVYSGHTVLDEKKAKLYGDAFSKASIGIESLPFDKDNYRPYSLEEVSEYKVERFNGQKYVFDMHEVNSSFVKSGSKYIESFKSNCNEMNRNYSYIPQGYDMTLVDMRAKEQAKFSSKIKNFFRMITGKEKDIPKLLGYNMPPVVRKEDNLLKTLTGQVEPLSAYYAVPPKKKEEPTVNSREEL